jgi:CheY-like chemotaxis protein
MTESENSILIVDDEPDIRLIITDTLSHEGFKVIAASSGPEALDILRSDPSIDLLFTDIVMPGGLDGFELAHRAKELRPDLRIIYSSGYIKDQPWGKTGIGYGPLLPKPFRTHNLIAEVRRALAEIRRK